MGNILKSDTLSTVEGIQDFKTLFSPTTEKPKGMMWHLWHELQLYASWGNKIPSSEDQLKLELHITDTAAYGFFPVMLEGYKEINQACRTFISETFPSVVKLGNAVNTFAKDASDKSGDGIFTSVLVLMQDNKLDDAFTLLKDLRDQAAKNAGSAGAIVSQLALFKARLETSQGKLTTARQQILADTATSNETIDKLMGHGTTKGELEKLKEELVDDQEEYRRDVIIASTTPTYAWVPGIGYLAAIIVAGIYGDKARKLLNEIERLTVELGTKTQQLKVALSVRDIQGNAEKGADQALEKTKHAITALGMLQGGWNAIASGLDNILELAGKMSHEDKLKSIAVVKHYADQAQKAWGELCGPLNDLLADPYIKIAPENSNIGALKKEVEAILDTKKKAA